MTLANVQNNQIKKNQLSARFDDEISGNEICVDLVVPYVIRRKGKKENLHLKAVNIIDNVTGWFEIAQYNDKKVISIANLVEITCVSRYSRPIELKYDQGSELIGHKFRKPLIED